MTKILLVEDDKSLREIYGIRLAAEGYEIISAGDGEEALAMAVREKPNLILSDVMMPKISGFDMLDILRSTPETKNIRVIMMTALSSDDQRERGESLGADKYLVKSQVGIEDVINAVHEVLGDRVAPGMVEGAGGAEKTGGGAATGEGVSTNESGVASETVVAGGSVAAGASAVTGETGVIGGVGGAGAANTGAGAGAAEMMMKTTINATQNTDNTNTNTNTNANTNANAKQEIPGTQTIVSAESATGQDEAGVIGKFSTSAETEKNEFSMPTTDELLSEVSQEVTTSGQTAENPETGSEAPAPEPVSTPATAENPEPASVPVSGGIEAMIGVTEPLDAEPTEKKPEPAEQKKPETNVFANNEIEIEVPTVAKQTVDDPAEAARLRKILDDEIAKMSGTAGAVNVETTAGAEAGVSMGEAEVETTASAETAKTEEVETAEATVSEAPTAEQ